MSPGSLALSLHCSPWDLHVWLLSSPAGCRYLTCLIHNCSAQPHTAPFAGPIDCGSLTVQDEYIFLKVSVPDAGRGLHMNFYHQKRQ